jgi:dTDP-4-dehydrorhamnose reductase
MRVLLTGANGQFGTEYSRYTAADASHDELHSLTHADLDVTSRDQVLQIVNAIKPDVVLHAGAWTNVDGCETDPVRALTVNALGTRHIAEAAALVDARVVYLSSDYVFDGRGGGRNGGQPYTEWDTPNPQSVYGRSKLGGEAELQTVLGSAATIVRTSWVAGAHGHNFVKTMVKLANDPGMPSPTVVSDQLGCPTFTADLVRAVRFLAVNRLPGIFHVSNTTAVSWCEFAKAIFSAADHDPDRVRPVTTAEYMAGRTALTAPRPAYSAMEHIAMRSVGYEMPSWNEALRDAVAALPGDAATPPKP